MQNSKKDLSERTDLLLPVITTKEIGPIATGYMLAFCPKLTACPIRGTRPVAFSIPETRSRNCCALTFTLSNMKKKINLQEGSVPTTCSNKDSVYKKKRTVRYRIVNIRLLLHS